MDDNNINEQILRELKLQTRTYRRSYIPVSIFLIAFLALSILVRHYLERKTPQKVQKEALLTWYLVEDIFERGNYDEAFQKALTLLNKNTEDYYSQACIAKMYLRKGDLSKAVTHAEIAYQLFPNKDNEETMEAMKKRLTSEKKKTSGPAIDTPTSD